MSGDIVLLSPFDGGVEEWSAPGTRDAAKHSTTHGIATHNKESIIQPKMPLVLRLKIPALPH